MLWLENLSRLAGSSPFAVCAKMQQMMFYTFFSFAFIAHIGTWQPSLSVPSYVGSSVAYIETKGAFFCRLIILHMYKIRFTCAVDDVPANNGL